MKILFTICGRAGSKGVANKNLRMFCGKPLVYFTVSAIDLYIKRNPDAEVDIVVNSDHMQLVELVEKNGMRHIGRIAREESLAGDRIGKIEVVRDCLIKMEKEHRGYYDIVVDLDITSPLRAVEDIEKVIFLHCKKNADVTITVAPARRNPYFNQVQRTEHGVKKVINSDFTARQQAPQIFDMNASIYAYKPAYLYCGKGVLDGYCEALQMYDTGVLDLDSEHDFELMQVIAAYLCKSHAGFREVYENIQESADKNMT